MYTCIYMYMYICTKRNENVLYMYMVFGVIGGEITMYFGLHLYTKYWIPLYMYCIIRATLI